MSASKIGGEYRKIDFPGESKNPTRPVESGVWKVFSALPHSAAIGYPNSNGLPCGYAFREGRRVTRAPAAARAAAARHPFSRSRTNSAARKTGTAMMCVGRTHAAAPRSAPAPNACATETAVPCGRAKSTAAAASKSAVARGSENSHPEYAAIGVARASIPAAISEVFGAIRSLRKIRSASATANAEKKALSSVRKKSLKISRTSDATPGKWPEGIPRQQRDRLPGRVGRLRPAKPVEGPVKQPQVNSLWDCGRPMAGEALGLESGGNFIHGANPPTRKKKIYEIQ